MKYILLLLLMCTLIAAAEEAQVQPIEPNPAPAIPGSEIMLFEIQQDAAGRPVITEGKNISNSPGYDSQPRFSQDGNTIYYTKAVQADGLTQMDIYQYNLESNLTTPYMTTAESEYSPTPMPDQAGLSVVQVDAAGNQYIVLLDTSAESDEQVQRHSDLKQVGYFNWTSGGNNWSFVLNDAGGGDLYHMGSKKQPTKLSDQVGRSFITDANHTSIYYVDKNTQPWRIKTRTAAAKESNEAKDVMALPMGVEDFTLDSQGRFWAGRGNTLFVSDDQKRWYIAHEFNAPDLDDISRLTTNPEANQIAIVFAEKTTSE